MTAQGPAVVPARPIMRNIRLAQVRLVDIETDGGVHDRFGAVVRFVAALTIRTDSEFCSGAH